MTITGLEDSAKRLASAKYITVLCGTGKIKSEEQITSLIQSIVPLFIEEDEVILKECWMAMCSVKSLIAEDMLMSYVGYNTTNTHI